MEFGVIGFNLGGLSTPDSMERVVVSAEQLGYESVWSGEHVVISEPDPSSTYDETWIRAGSTKGASHGPRSVFGSVAKELAAPVKSSRVPELLLSLLRALPSQLRRPPTLPAWGDGQLQRQQVDFETFYLSLSLSFVTLRSPPWRRA